MTFIMGMLRGGALLTGCAACALVIAACGGGGPSNDSAGNSGSAGSAGGPLALAKCMRAHGVPNFPDPQNGSGGIGISISKRVGSNTVSVNGVSMSGPAFQSAQKACSKYFPGGGKPPQLTTAQKQQLLKNAECMRAHGVPNFPDPTFSAGGAGVKFGPGSGVDPRSPAFQQAQKVCGPMGVHIQAKSSGS
jgi:hypothetical protein